MTRDSEFGNFMKGLSWFAESGCKRCFKDTGMPNREVRKCCVEKGLENYCFCKDFTNCEKLVCQRETYSIDDNCARIKQVGYENWLKEQERKLKQDFDNIDFLQKIE